ncbi:MAG: DNA-binding Lrp family transcriptional regulator [Pseudorhodobacter sp.]
MKITDADRKLLRLIQADASLSLAQLADAAGMAQSTIWRRIQELEATGVIRARVTLLDPVKVGAGLCVLAQVSLTDHSEASVNGFTALVLRCPEILECHKVSGSSDYALKLRCADVADYETFMSTQLLRQPFVRSLMSSFVLKEIKSVTELPL